MRIPCFVVLLACAGAAHADGSLWVPDQMILGHEYHGMVLLDEAAPEGSLVLLSAEDPHILDVPESVPVLPYQRHGIFPITPLAGGQTVVSAAGGSGVEDAITRVVSHGGPASLRIIPASDVILADSVPIYVMVSDEGGAPVELGGDLDVRLSGSGSMGIPHSVLIKNGTYHARVEVDVRGTGDITASSDGLRPHTVTIQKAARGIEVRIAVAPGIAMQDSTAFYYVWLEKDGRPFRPPHAVDVFLHSQHPDIARFEPGPARHNEGLLVRIVDGVARGILYTGERGQAVVAASTEEFGSGRGTFFVGPARMQGGNIEVRHQNLVGDLDGKDLEPNLLMAWIYPPVTDGRAWAVVGLYNSDKSRYLVAGDGGVASGIISEEVVVSPARPGGTDRVFVSSNGGLEHRGAYRVSEDIAKTNAIEFEVSGSSHGEHVLTVSGEGLAHGTSRVGVVPAHSERFGLQITPLPALPGGVRDVALVSVHDGSGALVDMPATFGPRASVLVHSDSARVHAGPPGSNSVVVRGVLDGPSHITAILGGVDPASAVLSPSRTASSLEVLAPGVVNIDEEFPFVVHQVDDAGVPVGVEDDMRITSKLDLVVDDGRMKITGRPGGGAISVVSGTGATEYEILATAGTLDIDVDFDSGDVRVGRGVPLEVTGLVGAIYDLLTDLPFVRTGDSSFLITPDEEGTASVTVTASRDGYEPVSVSKEFEARRIFTVDVRASDPAGAELSVPFGLGIDGTNHAGRTPYADELGPVRFVVDLPTKQTISGHGYALRGVWVNGAVHPSGVTLDVQLGSDTVVEATYEREVLVEVVGGEGSGVYGYGDEVVIRAPDREVLSFLVREVFDRWEGIDAPGSSATFAAERDVYATAIYREDYTYLMALVAAPLIAAGAAATYRGSAGLRWRVENIIEKAVKPIAGIKSSRKVSPRRKKE